VFKDGDRLTLLQYFSEGNALAKWEMRFVQSI